MGKVKFNKYFVTDGANRSRVFYTMDGRTDGQPCVTVYAKDYDHRLVQILGRDGYVNDTDSMTDYFEQGHVVLRPGHVHYAAARARAERNLAERAEKVAQRSQKRAVAAEVPKVFEQTVLPDFSPWGGVDHAKQVAPGIWAVSTSTHGGLLLSPQRMEALPEWAQQFKPFAGPREAFEEDVDFAVPVLAFRDEFPRAEVDMAEKALVSRADYFRRHGLDVDAAKVASVDHILERGETVALNPPETPEGEDQASEHGQGSPVVDCRSEVDVMVAWSEGKTARVSRGAFSFTLIGEASPNLHVAGTAVVKIVAAEKSSPRLVAQDDAQVDFRCQGEGGERVPPVLWAEDRSQVNVWVHGKRQFDLHVDGDGDPQRVLSLIAYDSASVTVSAEGRAAPRITAVEGASLKHVEARGESCPSISVSGTGLVDLKAWDESRPTVSVSNNAAACISAADASSLAIHAADTGNLGLSARGRSIAAANIQDSSRLIAVFEEDCRGTVFLHGESRGIVAGCSSGADVAVSADGRSHLECKGYSKSTLNVNLYGEASAVDSTIRRTGDERSQVRIVDHRHNSQAARESHENRSASLTPYARAVTGVEPRATAKLSEGMKKTVDMDR